MKVEITKQLPNAWSTKFGIGIADTKCGAGVCNFTYSKASFWYTCVFVKLKNAGKKDIFAGKCLFCFEKRHFCNPLYIVFTFFIEESPIYCMKQHGMWCLKFGCVLWNADIIVVLGYKLPLNVKRNETLYIVY